MKPLLLGVIAVLALGKCAEASCFSSPHEARKEHAAGAHVTWNYIDGQKCWRVGHPSAHVQHRGRRSYGMAALVPAIPMPQPRLDPEIRHPERYARLTPEQGRALMLYVLGE